jgi:hypothetical protein
MGRAEQSIIAAVAVHVPISIDVIIHIHGFCLPWLCCGLRRQLSG